MQGMGAGAGGGPRADLNGGRGSVWEDENVLETVVGGPCGSMNVLVAPNWTPEG